MTQAPFLPFTQPSIDEETIAAVAGVLRSGRITNGPKVKEFEALLSDFFGGRPVRTFSNGTSTMEMALRIAGIGATHEVITTPLSWVATANVILEVGATPVFVDVDPITRNIDLNLIEAAITPATRAILPVHLAGMPVAIDRLYDIAHRHRLRVVEDAAQAIGSSWQGRRIGSCGDFVSFSFQSNKNITTAEGGCLVLNDAEETRLAEKYRLQGVTRGEFDEIDVDVLGGKFNMNEIAAAMGIAQMASAEKILNHRRQLARHYFASFGSNFEEHTGIQLPLADFENTNWHLFQIVLPNSIRRRCFMENMMKRHIGTGFHYAPIHLFSLYKALGFHAGMFPVAERIGHQTVSLPLFNDMTLDDVTRVVQTVESVLSEY